MSLLERRLQLLLDQERYARVAGEAERSGRSVAAVIREAIDVRFADEGADARRSEALGKFLAIEPDEGGADSAEIATQLHAEFEGYVTKKGGR